MTGPIQVGFGWSGASDRLFSNAIRYATRPGWSPLPLARWSHMFLVFAFDDGQVVIHEALLASGWRQKPATALYDWLQADTSRHWACIEWLTMPPAVAEAIWRESCDWLGTSSYAWQQLAVMGMAETLAGRGLRRLWPALFNRDVADDRVVCSEGAGRLVGTHWPLLDLRQPGEPWAMVSPQAWWDRYQLKLATQRMRMEYDHGC